MSASIKLASTAVSIVEVPVPHAAPIVDLELDTEGNITNPIPHSKIPISPPENQLIISPYTGPAHLLDLSSLALPHQLFARALTLFEAVRPDYATSPYAQTFNFEAVVEQLRALVAAAPSGFRWTKQDYYVVAFRSRVKAETDREELGVMDERSFREAIKSGGLLKYWFGVPDGNRRNLATCFWRAREDASKGGAGDGHRKAARLTKGLYDEWAIEQLRLVIRDDVREWEVLPWNTSS